VLLSSLGELSFHVFVYFLSPAGGLQVLFRTILTTIRSVASQKSADLTYFAAEAWNRPKDIKLWQNSLLNLLFL